MAETKIWKIEQEFKAFPDFVTCEVVRGVTLYPKGAEELETSLWNAAVERKKQVLAQEGLELKVEDIEGRKALWVKDSKDEDFSMAMVPGFQYRLAGFDAKDQVLKLERVIYSEIEALKTEEYRNLFENEGLPLPKGPLAPVLYIITLDGYIVGTLRGKATNKYPEGIWGVGGDIDDPSLTIGEHIAIREAREEFKRFGGLSQQPLALGIVYDGVLKKHDLPIITTYNAVYRGIKKGKKYLADVESVTPISVRGEELSSWLLENYTNSLNPADNIWRKKPTPACHGGLFLVGKHLYGEDWAQEVLQKLSH